MPEFLSDEWIEALDAALRASATASALAPLILEQVVTGVPGRGDVRYRVWADGDGVHAAGCATSGQDGPPCDVRITTDYDTARRIAEGVQNAQIALGMGRLRLGGNVDALIARTDSLAGLEDATRALRADTTFPRSS